MDPNKSAVFDPETIEVLRSALDDAWASLLPAQQANVSRIILAERILNAATQGERDPARLRARALFAVAAAKAS